MTGETLYGHGVDNILDGGTVTADAAPLSSYSLTTLLTRQPAARVRFGVKTLTVTITLPAPARGDVAVVPVSNADPTDGGGSVLAVENDAGLSVEVPVPAYQSNGLPNTAIVDLVLAEGNATTRTSDVWRYVFTGNSVDLILGGGLGIFGPKRVLLPDIGWNFTYREKAFGVDDANEYNTRYILDYGTSERVIVATTRTNNPGAVLAWFQATRTGAAPGFFWPQIGWLDAYYGTWDKEFSATPAGPESGYYDIALTFRELSKGLVL